MGFIPQITHLMVNPVIIYLCSLQNSGCTVYTRYTISLHDHLLCFQGSNNMKVMEFDSIRMYSHILVGVGQSVVYQYTQCAYVCAHLNMFVHMCI